MAQLIKLESGSFLNLDNVTYIDAENSMAKDIGHGSTKLSPKDLEKIDQIADSTEVEYGEDLVLVTREAADKAGITYIMGG